MRKRVFTILAALVVVSLFAVVVVSCSAEISGTDSDGENGIKYTVTFDVNGGDQYDPKEYSAGSPLSDLPVPTKSGYKFDYWKDQYGNIYTTSSVMPEKGIELFAVWKGVKVIFDYGDTSKEYVYAINTEISEMEVVEMSGYEFGGWYLDSEFETPAVFPMTLSSDVVLYAKYEKYYKLTLCSSEISEIEKSVVKEAPEAEKREDLIFCGWYLDPEYTQEVTYPFVLTEDTTFYAKWEIDSSKVFKVLFVTNGGTPIGSIYCKTIEEMPVTQKSGMKFAGWYTSSRLVGEPLTFPYTLTKDITLYAKWVVDEESQAY